MYVYIFVHFLFFSFILETNYSWRNLDDIFVSYNGHMFISSFFFIQDRIICFVYHIVTGFKIFVQQEYGQL
jgi:hypothetical protein